MFPFPKGTDGNETRSSIVIVVIMFLIIGFVDDNQKMLCNCDSKQIHNNNR